MLRDVSRDELDPPLRLVALDAVHNFRDLGGYPTADGRITRWRVLFRADGLYRLTGTDLEVVRELGLRTVIDLRTPAELDARGTFPVEDHPVEFHHVSVIDTTWQAVDAAAAATEPDSDADFLYDAYQEMLEQGAPRLAEALTRLAAPGALPAVFHCAAGKDRTGVMAALLLSALGVPRDHVVADYALTAAGMERMRAWAAREQPEWIEQMAEVPPAMFAAAPEAMQRLLDDLDARYGSVRAYVRTIGVSEATLDALAAALLD